MNLFKANRQWAERPADERFQSLQELYEATRAYANVAATKSVPYGSLRVEANGEEVQLVGRAGIPAGLTHWAFGQLSTRVGAPASYLRALPATLAAQNLNYGLAHAHQPEETAALMFHRNDKLLLRAITSQQYSRIWNWEVARRLLDLEQYGWVPARPDFNASKGDWPSLYASDHDMFVFIKNASGNIREPGVDEPLQRGVIVENSEVGASALKFTRFLYRMMCGNHIIWGVSRMLEISLRHVGTVRDRFDGYQMELKRYLQQSPQGEEQKIALAKSRMIAANKEDLLDRLFGIKSLALSRKTLEAAYSAVVPDQDGSPRSQWGIVQGLTRHSQTIPYADQRNLVDRAAGRVLEIEF